LTTTLPTTHPIRRVSTETLNVFASLGGSSWKTKRLLGSQIDERQKPRGKGNGVTTNTAIARAMMKRLIVSPRDEDTYELGAPERCSWTGREIRYY
jgi:hypothetical protein